MRMLASSSREETSGLLLDLEKKGRAKLRPLCGDWVEWIVSIALHVSAVMMDAHVDIQLEGRRALHDCGCR